MESNPKFKNKSKKIQANSQVCLSHGAQLLRASLIFILFLFACSPPESPKSNSLADGKMMDEPPMWTMEEIDLRIDAAVKKISLAAGLHHLSNVEVSGTPNAPEIAWAKWTSCQRRQMSFRTGKILEWCNATRNDLPLNMVVAHEMGHCMYGHQYDPKKQSGIQNEFEADKFAGLMLFRLRMPFQDIEKSFLVLNELPNLQNSFEGKDPAVKRNWVEWGWITGYMENVAANPGLRIEGRQIRVHEYIQKRYQELKPLILKDFSDCPDYFNPYREVAQDPSGKTFDHFIFPLAGESIPDSEYKKGIFLKPQNQFFWLKGDSVGFTLDTVWQNKGRMFAVQSDSADYTHMIVISPDTFYLSTDYYLYADTISKRRSSGWIFYELNQQ